MSIHVHMLSIYGVPNTILDEIAKLAREFLWNRGSGGSSLLSARWDTVIFNRLIYNWNLYH